ncbi:protein NRT1/ PTR FAMILY 5.10 [Sesamum alatum]|uniref:Protein NRT1/ PTR FAMILY 5.10 n=1 Tax=Sesamum alatum TaxID=300844 RepID=A0AAE1XL17_9LAMI|nr:protein NRT1/ PTR FAMILY 5.10 [Sesamum alatum]
MTISKATGEEISEAELPLLKDVVTGAVDFKGRPAVRSKSGCWKSASFIIVAGVAERFAYYGISSNLISYLTKKLGQPTATAAATLNAWYGTSSLLPILGAFVADSFSGRFRTIIVAFLLYILGLSLLSLSASLTSNYSKCKTASENVGCSPPELLNVLFFFSLYLVAFAQGGLSPCSLAFGADQFDEEYEYECKAKSTFFNWWYFFSFGGILLPLLTLNYIQDNVGWELGFGIPAIVMCLALVLFLAGSMTYRFRVNADGRNPFARIYRVFVRAAKNWKAAPVAISIDEEDQQKCAQFRFLDKALLTPDGWIGETICSVEDVECTKAILRVVPVWFSCLGYTIVSAQPSTLFTKQAATIDLHLTSNFQLPAASLQMLFIIATVFIFLPLYDRVFVPIARAITKNPSGISPLQRVGIGLGLNLISIVFTAIIELKHLALAREYGLVDMPDTMIPMSVWWLAPQYVISRVANVFVLVGLQEFFYDEVPNELKSIGLAMYLSIIGVGSLLSSFLISSIQKLTSKNGQSGWFADNLNRAHLDYFYWLLGGLCAAGFIAFIYFAKYYVYKRRMSV